VSSNVVMPQSKQAAASAYTCYGERHGTKCRPVTTVEVQAAMANWVR
jgi:hypothetical protein